MDLLKDGEEKGQEVVEDYSYVCTGKSCETWGVNMVRCQGMNPCLLVRLVGS